MRQIKAIFLSSLLAFTLMSFAGVFDQISATIKAGNSKELSKYFGKTIDMTVLEKENVYSKAQAELILKDFFADHTPKSFHILHSGTSKSGLRYAIGTLGTNDGEFRVSFYVKKVGDRDEIKQLRIDPAED